MLRSFRLANHRSIRAEQELSLLPVYEGDREVQPVTAIYGANASGKSNVLDGLLFMREAVRDSYARWEPDQGIPRNPFRLDPIARTEPSHFVLDFVLAGVRHVYGFVVDDDQVLEEWLHSYPEKRRRVIFERAGDGIKLGTVVSDKKAKVSVLVELVRPNSLFLSLASRVNLPEILPIYQWIVEGFKSRDEFALEYIWRLAPEFILEHPDLGDKLAELMRFADFGISGLKIERSTGRDLEPRERVLVAHSNSEYFELDEESAGTCAWLSILLDVLPVLEAGGVLLIDEIDTSLHPRLTARLLELFQDEQTNPKLAQLICTTHDSTLLSPTLGEGPLRRGQVWFTEKNDAGETSLYPLSDFKPRKGENTERRYLGGSYGAVPRVFPEDFLNAVRRPPTGAA